MDIKAIKHIVEKEEERTNPMVLKDQPCLKTENTYAIDVGLLAKAQRAL